MARDPPAPPADRDAAPPHAPAGATSPARPPSPRAPTRALQTASPVPCPESLAGARRLRTGSGLPALRPGRGLAPATAASGCSAGGSRPECSCRRHPPGLRPRVTAAPLLKGAAPRARLRSASLAEAPTRARVGGADPRGLEPRSGKGGEGRTAEAGSPCHPARDGAGGAWLSQASNRARQWGLAEPASAAGSAWARHVTAAGSR